MALISLISAESELDLVVGYLLGAALIVISVCVLVGIFFMSSAQGNSNTLQGKSGFIHLLSLPRLFKSILQGRATQRGTLLFLALILISAVLVLIFFALTFSCMCFARAKGFEFVFGALFALVLSGLCLRRRQKLTRDR